MSSTDRSVRALEAALVGRSRDRERAERELASAVSEELRAREKVVATHLAKREASEDAADVWTAATTVARMKMLRVGATGQLEDTCRLAEAAESDEALTSERVAAARLSLQKAQAQEEATLRVVERKRESARRSHQLRAEDDEQ